MANTKAKQRPTLEIPGLEGGTEIKAEDLYRCVHCGLCLDQCPTYLELGLETESPRGRLALMKAVAEGRATYSERLVEHMDLCLLCRACEAACPSAVPFGSLMEATRARIQEQTRTPFLEKALRALVFKQLLPYPWRLRLAFRLMWLYQRTKLQALARRSRALRLLPRKVSEMESMLPSLPGRTFPSSRLKLVPTKGKARARVAFFSGCIMPLIFGPVNAATLRVLARNGCEVLIPRGQCCCGALNVHSGEKEVARRMARRNIHAFEAMKVDAIVVNSAGCGAMLKEYEELLEHDPIYLSRARAFAAKVKDISEFLAELPLEPPSGQVDQRVTYQEPCHLVHAQRIKEQPRKLLRSIPGLTLVEMPGSDRCCGAAGIYNIVQRDLSTHILDSKMVDVASTGVDAVVTANPGCMLQLDWGLRRTGVPGRSYHIVELLDQAYLAEERAGQG